MFIPTDIVEYIISFMPTFHLSSHKPFRYFVQREDIKYLSFLPLQVTILILPEVVDIPSHVHTVMIRGVPSRPIPSSWRHVKTLCVTVPPQNLHSIDHLEVLICVRFSVIENLPRSVHTLALLMGGKIPPSANHIHTVILGYSRDPILPTTVRDVYSPGQPWTRPTHHKEHTVTDPVDFILQCFF